MTKVPSQMKNLVDEWAKQIGYTVTDVTSKQGNLLLEWALEIKNMQNSVIVFTPKNTDMLRFQTQVNFSPEHQQKTATLSNEEYNAFVLSMTDRLAYLGCDWNFVNDTTNQKQLNALVMYFSHFMTMQIKILFYNFSVNRSSI
jgi:hypothetical protein